MINKNDPGYQNKNSSYIRSIIIVEMYLELIVSYFNEDINFELFINY